MAEEKGGIYRLFDVLAKIVAIVVLLAMASETIIALLSLIPSVKEALQPNLPFIKQASDTILLWSSLVLAGLVALEFGTKHNFIFFIIIVALLALVIIPRFIPGLWDQLYGAISAGI